jgi:hypothetical protein
MTSISEESPYYCDVCELAFLDDRLFKTFKQNKFYRGILEHVDEAQGLDYYNCIEDESIIKKEISKLAVNDVFGSPLTSQYNFGTFSPTTLRYAKVLNDLTKILDLNNKKIVEIGAGYGGQYLVTRQFYNPASYCFFDLSSTTRLIKKYIDLHQVNDIDLRYEISDSNSTSFQDYDLVISNYAISECDFKTQDYYIDNVISRSHHGYITYNHMKGYSIKEFILRLDEQGKDVLVKEEYPQTSPPNAEKNVIITW